MFNSFKNMDDGRFDEELDTDGSNVREIEDVEGEGNNAGERGRERDAGEEACRGSLLLVCLGSPRVFSACIAS